MECRNAQIFVCFARLASATLFFVPYLLLCSSPLLGSTSAANTHIPTSPISRSTRTGERDQTTSLLVDRHRFIRLADKFTSSVNKCNQRDAISFVFFYYSKTPIIRSALPSPVLDLWIQQTQPQEQGAHVPGVRHPHRLHLPLASVPHFRDNLLRLLPIARLIRM